MHMLHLLHYFILLFYHILLIIGRYFFSANQMEYKITYSYKYVLFKKKLYFRL